ncbi:MAG: rubrerythrin [Thermoplasmata archaeon]|nr:rubrerythrin [Thermoplasmata archaeon]
MLSKIPAEIKENVEKEVLRAAIIAELDAINLYEQMAAMVKDEKIKDVLMDVANEEKTHVGEFLAMLLKYDEKQVEELEKGRKEIEEILGGE